MILLQIAGDSTNQREATSKGQERSAQACQLIKKKQS